jgi:hypothetical protein
MPMKHLFQVILLAASLSIFINTARAALIEHNLAVEPNFVHGRERNSTSSTRSVLKIALPELTLAPGDLLRITVQLAGGKYLKLGPTPVDGSQYFGTSLVLQSGPLQGSTGYGDGATHTAHIFDSSSNLLFEEIQPASYFVNQNAPRVRYLATNLTRNLDYGQSTDLTFRKWVFELEMPTTITMATGGTFPYLTTLFNNNELTIDYYLYSNNYVDMPEVAVYVVPEPGTLCLTSSLALSVFTRRRK